MTWRIGARAFLAIVCATTMSVASCNSSSDNAQAPHCCRNNARNMCECHEGGFPKGCESRGEVETDACSTSETGGHCCANPSLGTCDCSPTRVCGDAEAAVLKCEPYPSIDGGIEAGANCAPSMRAGPCMDASECSCNETCVQVCSTCDLKCGYFGCMTDNDCRTWSSGFYTRCKPYDLNSRCEP